MRMFKPELRHQDQDRLRLTPAAQMQIALERGEMRAWAVELVETDKTSHEAATRQGQPSRKPAC